MVAPLTYRSVPSPLHATRAAIAALWVASLAAAALLLYHPVVLAGIGLAVLTAGFGAGVGRDAARSLRFALPLAVPIVVINVLISRQGLTVFARLGDLGPFGQGDLTVEAAVYGSVIALKVSIVILLGALASLAIDPDEMLAIFRRLSFRSALTASIALRMVPLLAHDVQRLAEAQRTRPGGAASRRGVAALRTRALLVGATVGGALDRAMDVAATLELRGYATAKAGRGRSRPLSRHDLAFLASAFAVVALALGGRIGGAASFDAYPLLHMPTSAVTLGLCVAIALVALAPFLDRLGIER